MTSGFTPDVFNINGVFVTIVFYWDHLRSALSQKRVGRQEC